MKVKVLVAQSCPALCDPMERNQAALSMDFTRREYWSGLPFPSPGEFQTQGLNPCHLHCRQIFTI